MKSRYEKTSKELLLRTRGEVWNITGQEDRGFIRVHVFGRHQKYFVRVNDLFRRVDRVVLYEKIYDDMRPVIYIAGPYSHPTPEGIRANIARAEKAGLACCRAGWSSHIPHKNFAGFEIHTDVPYEAWMAMDLSILARCDAILMLEGWASSAGASKEFEFAAEYGIPHFFARDGIPKPIFREVADA